MHAARFSRFASFSPFAKQHAALPAVLLATVVVRLPGIARPLLGDFATKNVIYAMIARNWANGTAPWNRPTVDMLCGGQPGWHLTELPLPAFLAGGAHALLGGSLDAWGRGVSIAASTLACALLYALVCRWSDRKTALAAATIWALSPVAITYGQSFMLEVPATCLALAALLIAAYWNRLPRALSAAALALVVVTMLATKIYLLALFPVLAAAWHQATRDDASGDRWRGAVVFFAVLSLSTTVASAWYIDAWRAADPAGPTASRVFFSHRQSAAAHSWPSPLLAQPGFWTGIVRNLATVALTPVGFMLAAAGLRRTSRTTLLWLACSCALVLLMPRKFHELNYYFVLLVPALAFAAAEGLVWLLSACARPRSVAFVLVLVAMLCSARYCARPAFITPAGDRPVMAAARAVRRVAREEDRVVALHGSCPDLLYYCQRRGWALSAYRGDLRAAIDRCRTENARYLVIVNDDSAMERVGALPGLSRIAAGNGFMLYRMAPLLASMPATNKTPQSPGTR